MEKLSEKNLYLNNNYTIGDIMMRKGIILLIASLFINIGIVHSQVRDNGLGISFNQSLFTIPLSSDIIENNQIVYDYTGVSIRYLYSVDDSRYLKLSAGFESYNINENSAYIIVQKNVSMSAFRFMFSGIQYHGDQKDISLYSTLGAGFILLSQDYENRNPNDLTPRDNIEEIESDFVFSIEYDLGLNVPVSDDISAFLEAGALLNFQNHLGLAPHLKLGATYWFD